MKRIVFFSVLAVIIIGGIVAYTLYNKKAPLAEDEKGMNVTTMQVATDFNTDSKAASTKYIGRTLNVSGEVVNTETNQNGQLVVTLSGGTDMPTVQATMRDVDVTAPTSSQTTIKGFCDAYLPGEELAGVQLPGTVVLTGCIINNNKN